MKIVVGFDGSAGARRALTWAASEAVAHGDELVVVSAWQVMPYVPGAFGMAPAAYPTDDEVEAVERRHLAIAEEARTMLPRELPGDRVATIAPRGHVAEALVAASAGARMLVVGSRGHGEFASLLLGSTSHHCAQHAHCPVVIVPASADV